MALDNGYFEVKKNFVANADYIRSMSDEELAILIRAVLKAEDCPATGNTDCDECFFKQLCSCSLEYLGRELEWLRQPTEG